MDKLLELKLDLKSSIASSYVDAPAVSKAGKLLFRNRELHDFSSFDCLGFSQNKDVRRAAQEALESVGFSCASSRKNVGTRTEHLLCEKALANFFGFQQALLFSNKNQAIFSLLATLLREQDQVVCGEDLAGLLSDVCLLLNCSLEVVDLHKTSRLEAALQLPFWGKRRFVIADTISQSSARKLDLVSLSSSCARHGALLILDESCAVGLIGARGAGAFELSTQEMPTLLSPLAIIAELGFGLGSFGASICTDLEIIDALIAGSKTLSLEPSIPVCLAAGIRRVCELSELKCIERALLETKRAKLTEQLSILKQHLEISCSSFISLKFAKYADALELQNFLFAKGFWVDLSPTPSKLSQAAYIKLFPSIFHTDAVIQTLVENIALFINKNKD